MTPLPALVDSFLTCLDVERGLSPHTVTAYRADCERFLESLAPEVRRDPSSLREQDLFAFMVSERKRGRSVSSVRRSVAAIKTLCRFLVRERVLTANPAENLETLRVWKTLPGVLEEGEIARLIAAVDAEPTRYPRRDRAILELGYATGLRVSEICGLTTDSIRRDLGVLKCRGKGSRERVVPISTTALEAVDDYEGVERPALVDRRPTDLLFVSRSGRPLGREVIARLLTKYARRAGLAGRVTPHMLRHSMATHLIRGGADLRIVQEILGHVKVETTEIYTHIDRSELKDAHRRFHPRG